MTTTPTCTRSELANAHTTIALGIYISAAASTAIAASITTNTDALASRIDADTPSAAYLATAAAAAGVIAAAAATPVLPFLLPLCTLSMHLLLLLLLQSLAVANALIDVRTPMLKQPPWGNM